MLPLEGHMSRLGPAGLLIEGGGGGQLVSVCELHQHHRRFEQHVHACQGLIKGAGLPHCPKHHEQAHMTARSAGPAQQLTQKGVPHQQ